MLDFDILFFFKCGLDCINDWCKEIVDNLFFIGDDINCCCYVYV